MAVDTALVFKVVPDCQTVPPVIWVYVPEDELNIYLEIRVWLNAKL